MAALKHHVRVLLAVESEPVDKSTVPNLAVRPLPAESAQCPLFVAGSATSSYQRQTTLRYLQQKADTVRYRAEFLGDTEWVP
jgi:hypothetical protein